MKIERGIVHRDLRIRLVLQSEDGKTHSVMSDNAEAFSRIASATREAGQAALEAAYASFGGDHVRTDEV
jgi:hypothetical protein